MKKQSKKHGFTLAEILITLSIIGVVAALTIPTLIQSTGNEEIVSRLMKTYSTLSQATELIITEQGSPKIWNTNVDNLYDAYKSHLRNSKDCGSNAGCLVPAVKQLTGYKINSYDAAADNRKLILSDGMLVEFQYKSSDCTYSNGGSNGICSRIAVDVNGKKEPNQYGRDIFLFALKETGLYPNGCDDADVTTNCNPASSWGGSCACRVIQEGAMNY